MVQKSPHLSMNRENIGVRKTLPHPGPLPLAEGESSSDSLIRLKMAAFRGVNTRIGFRGILSGWMCYLGANQTLRVWLISGCASRLR